MQITLNQGLSRPALWYRVRGALLPIEQDGREFAAHLAEITGLAPAQGRVLELEYRRFLYLAAIARGPRVPPGLVRVAWSYHAEHEGYARDFCPWVLGCDLAFTPTEAAPEAAYAETCAAYQAEFGLRPPAAIWPAPEARAALPPAPGPARTPEPRFA